MSIHYNTRLLAGFNFTKAPDQIREFLLMENNETEMNAIKMFTDCGDFLFVGVSLASSNEYHEATNNGFIINDEFLECDYSPMGKEATEEMQLLVNEMQDKGILPEKYDIELTIEFHVIAN